jgi:hypothetical protein
MSKRKRPNNIEFKITKSRSYPGYVSIRAKCISEGDFRPIQKLLTEAGFEPGDTAMFIPVWPPPGEK